MVLDYRERKPVSKNRPRKQPLNVFAVLITLAITVSFGVGLATGWLVFRPKRSQLAVAQQQTVPGQPGQPTTADAQSQAPTPDVQKTGEPPLTFYETLPKGSRAVIGSGLNPHSPGPSLTANPTIPPPPVPAAQPRPAAVPQSAPPPAKAPVAVKPHEARDKEEPPKPTAATKAPSVLPPAANKPAQSRETFSVQVASHKDRKEAEAVRDRLVARGMPAYIVESHLQDKGVWYRVRVGRGLEQSAANELATKAGKGAMTIPE